MTNMVSKYERWDCCYGVITSRDAKKIYLDLDNGELAKGEEWEFLNVENGSKVLCSIVTPSTDFRRATVKFESVVEYAFDGLDSLLARFFYRAGRYYCCVDVTCSLDLTGFRSDHVSVSQSDENCYTLALSIEGGDGK